MSKYLKLSALGLFMLLPVADQRAASVINQKSQSADEFDASWQRIERIWTAGIKKNKIVGSSLMFIKSGQIIKQNFYGMADLAQQRPVDRHTIYHWASITKTFTGIAIMQLRDRGLLALHDPVTDYIPELKLVYNRYGPMSDITIRQLLSHSAGFRAATWPWGGDEDWHPYEPQSWAQLAAMFPYTQILFKPGTRYSYSNPGIIFLGKIIEQICGEDYEVYIDKNILKPLEMYHSYFDHSPYHLLRYRSNSYFVRNEEIITNGLDFDTGVTVSNGGLNAPLDDMANYLSFLTGSLITENPVLNRSSLAEMWQPQLTTGTDDPFKTSIGLSFFIGERDGLRLIGHTGEQKGFMSFIYFEPTSQTAAILVFNTINLNETGVSSTRLLLADVLDAIYNNVWLPYKK